MAIETAASQPPGMEADRPDFVIHTLSEAEHVRRQPRINLEKIAAVGMLAAGAYYAKKMQIEGTTKELGSPWQTIVESCGHPVFGYVGAWFGHHRAKLSAARKNLSEVATNRRIAAGATIGVIVTNTVLGELGEGFRAHTYFDFMNHWFDGKFRVGETSKDLVLGAGLGAAAYAVHHLRQKKKASQRRHLSAV